ncbi:hypothetical protein [Nocardia yunnanensis]|uniref:hypothetical protein n=1 Tax=Nocardia yunnanensis TaxID=2382165 RepID=UPI0013C52EC2|nr:hypothetical protein [Nocardia yunnanensis]
MNWLVLGLVGVVEIAWSQSIKPTQNFTKPLPHGRCAPAATPKALLYWGQQTAAAV